MSISYLAYETSNGSRILQMTFRLRLSANQHTYKCRNTIPRQAFNRLYLGSFRISSIRLVRQMSSNANMDTGM